MREDKKQENNLRQTTMEQSRAETVLAPCPFCGTDPTLDTRESDNPRYNVWYLRCCGCDAMMLSDFRSYESPDLLKEKWNKRVPQISTLTKAPTATRVSNPKSGAATATSREQKGFQESERDWPEDAVDEDNGRYMSICRLCHKEFIGHKRRVTCKVCVGVALPKTEEEIADEATQLICAYAHVLPEYHNEIKRAILAALRQSRPVKEEEIS